MIKNENQCFTFANECSFKLKITYNANVEKKKNKKE